MHYMYKQLVDRGPLLNALRCLPVAATASRDQVCKCSSQDGRKDGKGREKRDGEKDKEQKIKEG